MRTMTSSDTDIEFTYLLSSEQIDGKLLVLTRQEALAVMESIMNSLNITGQYGVVKEDVAAILGTAQHQEAFWRGILFHKNKTYPVNPQLVMTEEEGLGWHLAQEQWFSFSSDYVTGKELLLVHAPGHSTQRLIIPSDDMVSTEEKAAIEYLRSL